MKLAEAEKHREHDQEIRARTMERNETEEYLYAVKKSRETVHGLTEEDKQQLGYCCRPQ